MTDILLEQAVYGSRGAGGYRFRARSPGFRDEWLAEAERLCTGFGDRPAGTACPSCVFARPLGKRHVAIVRAADQGADDTGRPGALAFHLLVLPRDAYAGFGGDPFALADFFPPPWEMADELPTLSLPARPLPPRTVEQVQAVLRRPDSAALLGGAQALVDGGRLVFERPAPDTDLLRSLWMLLPTSTRAELWPASFAFGNDLGFDVLVVPRAAGEGFAGYLSEEQAADYPEGRYELNLQIAAEAGDQHQLDLLFARRSAAETWRLGLVLLGVLAVLLAVMSVLRVAGPGPPPPAAPAPVLRLDLPPADHYPPLSPRERQQLTDDLRALAQRLGETPPPAATAEQLIEIIDRRLGTPDPRRDPGPIADWQPPKRQLQALLWKHGVAEYHDERLNPFELVQRLEEKVIDKGSAGKHPRE
ncbi:MAG TPA: hypothetical protein VNK04_16280 [Gemmataceae bacterium]|nr:hypothetical protein [Gemmataceae bacterium]